MVFSNPHALGGQRRRQGRAAPSCSGWTSAVRISRRDMPRSRSSCSCSAPSWWPTSGAAGLGRRMIAVRSNERAASASGIGVFRTKVTAFAISGALAGLAGMPDQLPIPGHQLRHLRPVHVLARAGLDRDRRRRVRVRDAQPRCAPCAGCAALADRVAVAGLPRLASDRGRGRRPGRHPVQPGRHHAAATSISLHALGAKFERLRPALRARVLVRRSERASWHRPALTRSACRSRV